jgi:hypothetical protein
VSARLERNTLLLGPLPRPNALGVQHVLTRQRGHGLAADRVRLCTNAAFEHVAPDRARSATAFASPRVSGTPRHERPRHVRRLVTPIKYQRATTQQRDGSREPNGRRDRETPKHVCVAYHDQHTRLQLRNLVVGSAPIKQREKHPTNVEAIILGVTEVNLTKPIITIDWRRAYDWRRAHDSVGDAKFAECV